MIRIESNLLKQSIAYHKLIKNRTIVCNYSQNILVKNSTINLKTISFEKQKRTFIQWSISGFSKKTENPVTFNQEEFKLSEPVNTIDHNSIQDSGYIPNPPEIPSEDIILNALGEPTLQSIGLGCISTPTGWVQLILEFLHINCDLSWYISIIIYTLIIRTLMMPITMGTLRFSAKMRIIGPQMVVLKEKVSEAIKNGDHREIHKSQYELTEFLRVNNIKMSGLFYPLYQIPFMMSTFFGLRNMCNLPVESFRTGGALWFQDLTITDPYFILPLISASTLFIMIQKGMDTGQAASDMTPIIRSFMYGMTGITALFLSFQTSGIVFYIVCSNFYSLIFNTIIFNRPEVKKFFNIPIVSPEMEKHLIGANKKKDPGFMKGFQDSMTSTKIMNELEMRKKYEKYGASTKVITKKNTDSEKKI